MPETDANSIGRVLRSERLRRGKALDVIAAETKICPAILDAIENDRFDSLPGGAYRRGFVRQYARALGLDEEDAVATFRVQHLDLPVALPPVPPKEPLRHLRGPALLLLAALAVVGFYKVAQSENPERRHSIVDRAPKPVVQPSPEPARPQSQAAQPPAEPATNKPPESSVGAPVHAVFTMTEPVWISVSCDGKPTYTGTLLEKESRSFEASAAVTVLVGNAGGLTITLNGQPVGPLGAHGEIEFLELTPQGTRRLPRSRTLPSAGDRPEA
jgi:cytoskeletal protein RodZ